jgi:hypothetical protein
VAEAAKTDEVDPTIARATAANLKLFEIVMEVFLLVFNVLIDI